MSPSDEPKPRPRLLRTRRGWVVGVIAALASGAAVDVAVFASANDGTTSSCWALTTTTSTVTTETTPPAVTVTSPAPAPSATETSPPDAAASSTTPTVTDPCVVPTVPTGTTQAPAPDVVAPAPAGAEAPAGHANQAPAAVSQAAEAPSVSPRPAATERAHKDRSRSPGAVHPRRHRHRAPAQTYFPPVSVDWQALTPLAPPPFPGSAAQDFPGPYFLLPIYQAAATQYDVPWQVLAAINEVETNWGANMGPSSAGAVGWMQFLPSTWRHFGVDANGDGVTNPEDPVDAIFSAAHYLHEAGAENDLGRAIFAYNHGNWYVDEVVRRAVELGSIPEDLLTALTEKGRLPASRAIVRSTGSRGLVDRHAKINSIGRAILLGNGTLRRVALRNNDLSIYGCGREDVAAGVVDRRVLEVLSYLAAHHLRPTVTSLRCGHGYYTTSGNVSEHSSGDAVDISAINGVPILGHQGPGSITEKTITELLKLAGGMKPHQIISLMTFQGATNTFAMGDHANHIHIGFRPLRDVEGL